MTLPQTLHFTAVPQGVGTRPVHNNRAAFNRAARRAALAVQPLARASPYRLQRVQALSSESFADDIPADASAADRLRHFVGTHTRRLEFVAPFHRTAAMVESIDPEVAAALRRARSAAAHDLDNALAALPGFSPDQRHLLIMRLHLVCSWQSWEFLRSHYRLSPPRARAIVTDLALTVLAAAERGARREAIWGLVRGCDDPANA